MGGRRVVELRVTACMQDRVYRIVPGGVPLLAVALANNEELEPPPRVGEWVLYRWQAGRRVEVQMILGSASAFRILIVEERPGVPSFPGLVIPPLPGAIRSPGDLNHSIPPDVTAVYRSFVVP